MKGKPEKVCTHKECEDADNNLEAARELLRAAKEEFAATWNKNHPDRPVEVFNL